jgi:hypothetical protein
MFERAPYDRLERYPIRRQQREQPECWPRDGLLRRGPQGWGKRLGRQRRGPWIGKRLRFEQQRVAHDEQQRFQLGERHGGQEQQLREQLRLRY